MVLNISVSIVLDKMGLDKIGLDEMGLGMTPIKVLKSRSNQGRLDKVKHSPRTNGTYGDTGFTVDKLASDCMTCCTAAISVFPQCF